VKSILRTARLLITDPKALAQRLKFKVGWIARSGAARYTYMQHAEYERAADASDYTGVRPVDHVVGSYEAHNSWPDYETFLMRYVDDSFSDKLALDFGCGPGRHIVQFGHRFRRMDGADISARNLENARQNLQAQGIAVPDLYVTSGTDLGAAPSAAYDFVMSVITLQHICVHEIRLAILRDIARILKPGGRFSSQMGFGTCRSLALLGSSIGYARSDQVTYIQTGYSLLLCAPSPAMVHDLR